MIGYFSRTGTRKNLAELRKRGWGILVSRAGRWNRQDFALWVADCGAWSDFTAGQDFDEAAFRLFLVWIAEQEVPPQWLVIPDVVGKREESLALSRRWVEIIRADPRFDRIPLVLAVQDGMTEADVRPFIGRIVGLFVGGSTEWKLATKRLWAAFAHSWGGICHCARVNSEDRVDECGRDGVDSFDGSGVSRWFVTIGKMDRARKAAMLWRGQGELFA